MASFNQKTLNTSSRSKGFSGIIKSWMCSSSCSSRSWVNLSSGGLDCTFVRDWWIGWRDQILLGIVGKWNCDGLIKLLHNTTPPPPPRVLAPTRLIHRKTVARMMPKIDQNHFSSDRNKNSNNEMVQMGDDWSFFHHQQGRIDFNTVNPSLSTGNDFLIHSL